MDFNNFECYSPGFSDGLQSGEEEELQGIEEVLFAPDDASKSN